VCTDLSMSQTCKSPKAIVRAALWVGRVLPDYSHRFSPQKFTPPQLFACLVFKEVLKTDCRGLVAFLKDCADLRGVLGLGCVPHFTTLQKASKRLLRLSRPARSYRRCSGRRRRSEPRWSRAGGLSSAGPVRASRHSEVASSEGPRRATGLPRIS